MATDGKYYTSDAADTETLLRLIQSIPSPKAEPFKLWLAKVGYERMEEMEDPELSFDRAMKTYLQKGYSERKSPKGWKTTNKSPAPEESSQRKPELRSKNKPAKA